MIPRNSRRFLSHICLYACPVQLYEVKRVTSTHPPRAGSAVRRDAVFLRPHKTNVEAVTNQAYTNKYDLTKYCGTKKKIETCVDVVCYLTARPTY